RTVSAHEAKLLSIRADLITRLAAHGVAVLSDVKLATQSPMDERWSLRSELEFDFPYSVRHADAIACEMAQVLLAPPRKKGIVVDLDNTLWAGIVGDDGVENVSWELAARSQHHAFFQRLLNVFAESGIFVGVASKNDAEVAEQALGRADLLVSRKYLYPVLANWGAKSASIQAIAKAWNVAENSLVFVDDSALEREEVERAQPAVYNLPFPVGNLNEFPQFMQQLRDCFGALSITDEDKLRVASVQGGVELAKQIESSGELANDVLAGLQAKLKISERTLEQSQRALQLINKTNQFNINGRRWESGELAAFLNAGGKLISVEYGDRYGHLGEISSLLVNIDGDSLEIVAWVLSCRAFARRIEYATVSALVSHFKCQRASIAVKATGRNGPALRALAVIAGSDAEVQGDDANNSIMVAVAGLLERMPPVFADITTSFTS
ncbi:MAG: HAD-IIIC family phosphatase, partial [Gemmatimonadota bacterium]|nr:HAD-IIIC family phosphatase [Gemmatimonadota bacterium]